STYAVVSMEVFIPSSLQAVRIDFKKAGCAIGSPPEKPGPPWESQYSRSRRRILMTSPVVRYCPDILAASWAQAFAHSNVVHLPQIAWSNSSGLSGSLVCLTPPWGQTDRQRRQWLFSYLHF